MSFGWEGKQTCWLRKTRTLLAGFALKPVHLGAVHSDLCNGFAAPVPWVDGAKSKKRSPIEVRVSRIFIGGFPCAVVGNESETKREIYHSM